MTEANETQLPLDGESLESPTSSLAAEPLVTLAKKTPRRKVASRPKSVAVAVEEDGVPPAAKPRRPATRRSKAAASGEESTAAAGTAAPAENAPAQAEVFAPQDLIESPDPQSRVETQIITPKVMRELEARTAVNFGTDGNIPAPTAQAPVAAETPASTTEQRTAFSSPVPAPDAPARQVVDPTAIAGAHQVAESESTINPTAPAALPPEVPIPAAADSASPTPTAEASAPAAFQPQQQQSPRGERFPQQHQQSHPQQHQQRHGQPQQGRHQRDDRYQRDDRRQPRDDQRQDRQGRFDHQPRGGGDGQQQRGGDNQQQRGDGQNQQPQQNGGGNGDPLVSRPTETQYGEGIIEVSGKGFGFLREAKRNFVQTPADIFVTPEVCRKYNLRDGQWIKGEIRRSSRGPQLFRLTQLNGDDPEKFRNLPNFEELTTINPRKRIKLETVPERYTTRIMDLMTPIGKGQRGLIVAPPRTGKTTLLQHIAEAVVKNHPEMKLIILLVDERPEEVTEIRRAVPEAEIMASSNDSDLKSHTRIAQLAMERSKRLVEAGQHVFILLDSITRMARAFNNSMSGGRASQSGGLAVGALEIPRKIFAAARNTEEAGSLTIMATALIETNSKMDDAIFQEFKGTGNMELVLDRKISDQRIYPAVDIFLSGTRREELLLQAWELDKINVIRRGLAGHKPIEAIERLLSFLKKFPTNAQMLASLPG